MADHFVDPTGELAIEATAASGSLFMPANGCAASRGVSPAAHATCWLWVMFLNIDPCMDQGASLHESQISRTVLDLPVWSGWRSLE